MRDPIIPMPALYKRGGYAGGGVGRNYRLALSSLVVLIVVSAAIWALALYGFVNLIAAVLP